MNLTYKGPYKIQHINTKINLYIKENSIDMFYKSRRKSTKINIQCINLEERSV